MSILTYLPLLMTAAFSEGHMRKLCLWVSGILIVWGSLNPDWFDNWYFICSIGELLIILGCILYKTPVSFFIALISINLIGLHLLSGLMPPLYEAHGFVNILGETGQMLLLIIPIIIDREQLWIGKK